MDYTACPRSLYQFYQLISILKLVRLLGHTIVFKLIGRYPIGQFILRKKQIITVSYRHYIYDYHDIALYLLVSCPKWGGKKYPRFRQKKKCLDAVHIVLNRRSQQLSADPWVRTYIPAFTIIFNKPLSQLCWVDIPSVQVVSYI